MHINIILTSSGDRVECAASALWQSPLFRSLICLNARSRPLNRHSDPRLRNSSRDLPAAWSRFQFLIFPIPRALLKIVFLVCHEDENCRSPDAARDLQDDEFGTCLESGQRGGIFCSCFPSWLARCGPDFELRDPQPQRELRPVFGEITTTSLLWRPCGCGVDSPMFFIRYRGMNLLRKCHLWF